MDASNKILARTLLNNAFTAILMIFDNANTIEKISTESNIQNLENCPPLKKHDAEKTKHDMHGSFSEVEEGKSSNDSAKDKVISNEFNANNNKFRVEIAEYEHDHHIHKNIERQDPCINNPECTEISTPWLPVENNLSEDGDGTICKQELTNDNSQTIRNDEKITFEFIRISDGSAYQMIVEEKVANNSNQAGEADLGSVVRRSKRKVKHSTEDGDDLAHSDEPSLLGNKAKRGKGRPCTGKLPEPLINDKGEKVHVCEVCKLELKTYHSLLVHTRTHTGQRPFACEICQKTFTTKGNMTAHMSTTHSEVKPWTCESCGKAFKEKKVLEVHMRTHTGEKPYSCPECSKCFNQNGVLKEHMLIHEGVKPHLCDLCGQYFRTMSNLKAHKRRHENELRLQCPTCGLYFSGKNALKQHEAIHNVETTCEMCNIAFNSTDSLQQHLFSVHGELTATQIYQCTDCNQNFLNQSEFVIHRKLHGDFVVTSQMQEVGGVNENFIFSQSGIETVYLTTENSNESKQLMTFGDQEPVKIIVGDNVGMDFEKFQLISAAMNADVSLLNSDSSKPLYQVYCVNPNTQEVLGQVQDPDDASIVLNS
ncbi:zinc finger protein ZFP2-like isoform X2 [Dreissena polymorpha]|uniref:C2H2-type domain-containing protein n=2 Tax=Dreissena polymorpha TaxID=45954 RepID=A0A9D4JPQ5_DREPO|nr:zinc finger protein ZFP2-like isoform X2 [Dreissena polymorpha]KAH3816363.1 hypothetical protein DPMN_117879 [Dreissena polymorpha]